MLIARKMTKRYGEATALASLDLEIARGEVFCLLGPNGAGKTTTINLFLGFTQPTSGESWVGTVHVQADPLAARARIAYVPEQVRLYPHLTGCENLAYFLQLASARAPRRSELEAQLTGAGLPPSALHRRADGYSKGMRQKVVLALAHAKQAQALLLDEPTSGLDPSAADELYAGLRRERDRGAAVLMVTHDLSAVTGVATRFGIMKSGRLVHVGAAAGLSEADVQALYRQHLRPTVEATFSPASVASVGQPALSEP
ncbi:MAG: ABC transporter ATP-binding protein [Polyangiales bacterium]